MLEYAVVYAVAAASAVLVGKAEPHSTARDTRTALACKDKAPEEAGLVKTVAESEWEE